ncbi:MAG: LPD38 domain-containing protein [Pseudomonadota bacterium]
MGALDDIRAKHPEYKDIPDDVLADGIYRKFYAEKMGRDDFDLKIGLTKRAPKAFLARKEKLPPAGPANPYGGRGGDQRKAREAARARREADAEKEAKATMPVAADRARRAARGLGAVVAGIPESLAIAGRSVAVGRDRLADQDLPGLERDIARAEEVLQTGVWFDGSKMTTSRKISLQNTLRNAKEQAGILRRDRSVGDSIKTTPVEETPLYEAGQGVRDFVSENLGDPDPVRDEEIWGKIAEGGGNLVGFVGAYLVGGVGAGAGLGASMNSAEIYREAKGFGATDEEARRSAGYASLVGASEVAPLAAAFRPLAKALPGIEDRVAKILIRAVQTGAAEGAQEGLAQIANNFIAQGIYDPERGWADGVGEAMIVGATLGAFMGGGVAAAQGDGKASPKQIGRAIGREMLAQLDNAEYGNETGPVTMQDRINAILLQRGLPPIERMALPGIQPKAAPAEPKPAVPGAPGPAISDEPQKIGAEFATEDYLQKTIQRESAGRADAKNPRSSAEGLGQFIDSTWLATVRQHAPEVANDKSDAEILALKTDDSPGGVAFQRRMLAAFTDDNARGLAAAGVDVTPGNLYLAHFLGLGGARAALGAADGAKVADVMPASVVDANPFLRDWSIGKLKDWAASKYDDPSPAAAAEPDPAPAEKTQKTEKAEPAAKPKPEPAPPVDVAAEADAILADLDKINTEDARAAATDLRDRVNDARDALSAVSASTAPPRPKQKRVQGAGRQTQPLWQPGPKHQPMRAQMPSDPRPAADQFSLNGRVVKLRPIDSPTTREGIRVDAQRIIGPRLYQEKIRGNQKLGYYRHRNSEVRLKNFDDVEVLAHEMAHWMDFHKPNAGVWTKFRDGETVPDAQRQTIVDEISAISYDISTPEQARVEGFAEFLRLWLTQHDVVAREAPNATAEFERILANQKKLGKQLTRLQEDMHRWFLQGDDARLRSKRSGKNLRTDQAFEEWRATNPAARLRNAAIDRLHGAKVAERTVTGDGLTDAERSAYKMLQMANGAEGVHQAVMRYGTPKVMPDGSLEFRGKSLNDIFQPIRKDFEQALDYFAARRAAELKRQGRENLFTDAEIQAGLALGRQNPKFKKAFSEWQKFNAEMLDFYVDMGLITSQQRSSFSEANKDYVPFHRVVERVGESEARRASKIGKRLTGGGRNTRDIAINIVEGLHSNIRAAMLARGKNRLFQMLDRSQEGSLFAVRIGRDSQQVQLHVAEMARRVAQIMAAEGLTVSSGGIIVSGNPQSGQITDVADIEQQLINNPDLLQFWLHGRAPRTTETHVESAILDDRLVYFEVRDPLLVTSLQNLTGTATEHPVLQVAQWSARFFSRTITSAVQFLGMNAVRDTTSAAVMSKSGFRPVVDTLIGMGDYLRGSQVYRDFMLNGGGYGTRIEEMTKEGRARAEIDLPNRSPFHVAMKGVHAWEGFASMFEYGSRIGEFRRARAKGKTKIEAAHRGREISTDFGQRGSNNAMVQYNRSVPFMNAAIQGLDKISREVFEHHGKMSISGAAKFDENRKKFYTRGAVLTGAALALTWWNQDDERYHALTADEKARFMWIFVPGMDPIKIPKAYDVGAIFMTLPEIVMDYAYQEDGQRAAQDLAQLGVHSLGFVTEAPHIIGSALEIGRNRKFTGAPIIPDRLADAPPAEQYTSNTPIIYREVGGMLGVSPLHAEHVTRSMIGYVEAYLADFSEAYLWDKESFGARPFARDPVDYLTHGFKVKKVPARTRWTEGYYDLRERTKGIEQALRERGREGRGGMGGRGDLLASAVNRKLVAVGKEFARIDRSLGGLRPKINAIKYDKSLSAPEKEKRIDALYALRNDRLGEAYQKARDVIREAEERLK